MRTFSYEAILRLNPCYSDKKLRALWAGRSQATLKDILEANIPLSDKTWLLCEMSEYFTAKQLRALAFELNLEYKGSRPPLFSVYQELLQGRINNKTLLKIFENVLL